jgi:hypothetical protein
MWKVHLENLVMTGNIGFRMYVMREHFDGKVDVMQPSPVLKTLDAGSFVGHEQAWLDDSSGMMQQNVRGMLQAMSDAAWEIGIKPKQIEDHTSELKATKYHLEDMRALVLK